MRGYIPLNPDYCDHRDERDLFEDMHKDLLPQLATPNMEYPLAKIISPYEQSLEYDNLLDKISYPNYKEKKKERNLFKWLLRRIHLLR